MFHTILEQIIGYAVKNNLLCRNRIDEYVYGLEISLSVSASYLSVITIGFLKGMLWQSALFLFIFNLLDGLRGDFIATLNLCVICLRAVYALLHY